MGVIHQGPADSRDRKERTMQGQSHSPRMLCTKMPASRQDKAATLLEAPDVLPASIPAGFRGDMEKHLLLILIPRLPSSSVSSRHLLGQRRV